MFVDRLSPGRPIRVGRTEPTVPLYVEANLTSLSKKSTCPRAISHAGPLLGFVVMLLSMLLRPSLKPGTGARELNTLAFTVTVTTGVEERNSFTDTNGNRLHYDKITRSRHIKGRGIE